MNKEYIFNNFTDKNKKLSAIKINKQINQIPKEYNWCKSKFEYVYCVFNDITEQPSCRNCKKKIQYIRGYSNYCSKKCSINYIDPKLIIKNKLTKEYINNNLFNNKHNLDPHKLKYVEIPKEYDWCLSIAEYVYCILNDISSKPMCSCSKNSLSYSINKKKYNSFCSPSCAQNSKEVQAKNLKTRKNINNDIFHPEELTKEYIINNLLKKDGLINFNKINNITIPKEYDWCLSNDEYIYCILNNIQSKPLCIYCKEEEVKYKNDRKGQKKYNDFCSPKCSGASIQTREKTIQTNIHKYGEEYAMKTSETQDKSKKTIQDKYGTDYFFNTKEYKKKTIQTNINKYGVENYLTTKECDLKRKKTIQDKYGVKNVFESEEIKSKIKQSNLKNMQVENYSQTNINNKEEYYELIKYYPTNPSLIDKWIDKSDFFLIEDFCIYFNITRVTGNRIKLKLNIPQPNKNNRYQIQKEIYDYIARNKTTDLTFNDNDVIYFLNNKDKINKLELDIYLKKEQLAIEFNGLLFHSFGKSKYSMFNNSIYENEYKKDTFLKNRNKHLFKTKLCEDKDIQLFHIFENEWIDENKQLIWKSMINSKLQKSEKIYARNCEVRDLSKQGLTKQELLTNNKLVKNFIIDNHIQGFINSKIKLGLYYKEELVSVMTFSKSNDNKNYEWELKRFCSKLNTNVIGGGGKLLKYFERNYKPKSLLSYANRRWTSIKSNIYQKLDFELSHISEPNFFYFKPNNILNIYSRKQYQKHLLKDKLDNFDSSKTAIENMYDNDFRRIWDSGNLVYIKKYILKISRIS